MFFVNGVLKSICLHFASHHKLQMILFISYNNAWNCALLHHKMELIEFVNQINLQIVNWNKLISFCFELWVQQMYLPIFYKRVNHRSECFCSITKWNQLHLWISINSFHFALHHLLRTNLLISTINKEWISTMHNIIHKNKSFSVAKLNYFENFIRFRQIESWFIRESRES